MFILSFFTLLPILSIAQSQEIGLDVNSIDISREYTKQEVVEAWGEPDIYYHNESDNGISERYYYGNSGMMFSDGYLTTISLSDNKFSIFTSKSGGLKVGDPLHRISELKLGELIQTDQNTYNLKIEGLDDMIKIRTVSNKISFILYIMSS